MKKKSAKTLVAQITKNMLSNKNSLGLETNKDSECYITTV